MDKEDVIVIVESDILVRHPLAEYLRECGYTVLEAADIDEARLLIDEGASPVDIVLADCNAPGENGFHLASWVRVNHPDIDVILAGSVAGAAEKAGDLCEEGPTLTKPYDHRILLDHIRRLVAARDRRRPTE
ncbi:MAG: response regulator [Stellaceae bacterium]